MARYAMVIDLARCTACQACAIACKMETNVPHTTPETFKNRKMSFRSRIVPLARDGSPADLYPVLCNQCDNPPCVAACPTGASYRRADGIVLIDWDKCIGCRYCMAACPYDMRYLVLAEEPKEYQNPDLPQPAMGKVDKCTFCAHLVDRGMEPACVTACPAGARIFGDLTDPNSPVSRLLAVRSAFALRPGFNTKPMVSYVK